jgi:hypothetical protein
MLMVGRAALLMIAALALAAVGWSAVRARGSTTPGDAGVTVGPARVGAAQLEAAAARSAGAHRRRLAAARRAVASRAIERLWLEGEAAARGLRPAAPLDRLRGQIADALVGHGRVPRPARFAAAFEAFHERWRARTRCLPDYREPYEDRCGDGTPAAAGTRHWMGEATVCGLRGRGRARWLVVRESRSARAAQAAGARLPLRLALRLVDARAGVVHLGSRADALSVARALYVVAHGARLRAAAAVERRAAERARAAAHARAARALAARARDPRLTDATLAFATGACRRQLRDSAQYLFGFGMQDVAGQTQGLTAARAALARRLLASTADAVDRRKLRHLVAAIAAGSRELRRLAASPPPRDLRALAARIARLDARTEPERAISRRLGLGDCLARPAA